MARGRARQNGPRQGPADFPCPCTPRPPRPALLSSSLRQDPDPDRERAERNKLRKRVRRELKGAVRELRKDNAFLEQQQTEQLLRQRKARDERAKAIETFLTQQQFEAKIGRGKGKRRR